MVPKAKKTAVNKEPRKETSAARDVERTYADEVIERIIQHDPRLKAAFARYGRRGTFAREALRDLKARLKE